VRVYDLTADLPADEKFGLTSQIRRSAVSIPSNIAEGLGRKPRKELNNFLYISPGSISELDTQITIAQRLVYSVPVNVDHELKSLRKMLFGLISGLKDSKND